MDGSDWKLDGAMTWPFTLEKLLPRVTYVA